MGEWLKVLRLAVFTGIFISTQKIYASLYVFCGRTGSI